MGEGCFLTITSIYYFKIKLAKVVKFDFISINGFGAERGSVRNLHKVETFEGQSCYERVIFKF